MRNVKCEYPGKMSYGVCEDITREEMLKVIADSLAKYLPENFSAGSSVQVEINLKVFLPI